MPILKLTPSCKDYLWGGSRLRTDFGIKSDLDPLAEAWVLSCHPDGPSYLPDGTTLAAYIAAHPGCLGTDCDRFEQFPILTKFIDAKQNLSVQVHPSNEYALEKEHQYGKTEMWYVLDCVPGAYLYYGLTHEISKEELAERIKNKHPDRGPERRARTQGRLLFYPVRHAARHLPGHRRGRGAAKTPT